MFYHLLQRPQSTTRLRVIRVMRPVAGDPFSIHPHGVVLILVFTFFEEIISGVYSLSLPLTSCSSWPSHKHTSVISTSVLVLACSPRSESEAGFRGGGEYTRLNKAKWWSGDGSYRFIHDRSRVKVVRLELRSLTAVLGGRLEGDRGSV